MNPLQLPDPQAIPESRPREWPIGSPDPGRVCGSLLVVRGDAYHLLLPYQCYPNVKLGG